MSCEIWVLSLCIFVSPLSSTALREVRMAYIVHLQQNIQPGNVPAMFTINMKPNVFSAEATYILLLLSLLLLLLLSDLSLLHALNSLFGFKWFHYIISLYISIVYYLSMWFKASFFFSKINSKKHSNMYTNLSFYITFTCFIILDKNNVVKVSHYKWVLLKPWEFIFSI